ncbi:MAG: HK97 gp10 family phage protein [Gemmatimonadaceae bacterium]|nr:HK97 gp10 family phage protein [Gemmatimonadaceae bacterium]
MAGQVSVIVVNHVKGTRAMVDAKIGVAVRKAAFDIEAQAKARAPVDTGNLRNSINASGDGADYRVDSPANYSLYQEFGTRKMAAHPYMIPAAELVKPALIAALKRIV